MKLIDPARKLIATARVTDEGAYYGGTIDLRDTPADVRSLFEEFEEIVDGQMFSFLDDIQGRIGGLLLRGVFDSGVEVDLTDLQVFPSTGAVSFRLADVPAATGEPH